MARSRRAFKKTRSTVRVGLPKRKSAKKSVPEAVCFPGTNQRFVFALEILTLVLFFPPLPFPFGFPPPSGIPFLNTLLPMYMKMPFLESVRIFLSKTAVVAISHRRCCIRFSVNETRWCNFRRRLEQFRTPFLVLILSVHGRFLHTRSVVKIVVHFFCF
jgi:hypothetical protein